MQILGLDEIPQGSVPSLGWAHPLVREWFQGCFGTPTEPQEQGWPPILAGQSTLICAPTGSGKTLAAFLACLDRLFRKALEGRLEERTEVLYVSPLKALSNDIRRNLEAPLSEITSLAGARGLALAPVRAAVRTGDTLMPERRAMLAHPPHILVTTPESLYILLTAEKSRAILRDVETVIVDEIHAVADDKRGAHLALSLERLDALIAQSHPNRPAVRIGLSATQKPIELVAKFLAGNDRAEPVIINIGRRRTLDLAVEVPRSELGPIAGNDLWEEVYDRLAELVRQHRSTLVFVNTRRLSERLAHHLARRLGPEAVAAHHGSLARKVRLAAEDKLKAGEVRVLVATASLELGIDIGTVDLVCQIGSTRSIGVALQRIGRSGHWRGAVPKGRFFATTRDDLIECVALVRALRQGELDRLEIPESPLDVLAQQIVAMCACEDWSEDDLYAVLRRAYPYRGLARAEFDSLVEILSEGISARRGRYGAHLHRDRVLHRLRGRRGSRLVAITNGGAIPESALYTVVAMPEGVTVGTVSEDFAVESMAGDVFLLGNTSWRIRRTEGSSGRLLVEDAQGVSPNIPFWLGEAPARTPELSAQVAEIRQKISDLAGPDLSPADEAQLLAALKGGATPEGVRASPASAVSWLCEECGVDEAGAEQAVAYILAGRAALGAVPTQNRLIAERFFDEAGGMQLVIHAPWGGKINKAWGLALRKRFCRAFNFELQAAATEDGLNISLGEQHSFPLAEVFHFLSEESVASVLEQAALVSPIFATRWRWDATRALALPRFRNGKKVPLPIQRMRADDLLAAVFPEAAACQDNIEGDRTVPDHPLIREVMKDVLTEALDIEGLKRVLRGISDGSIQCVAVDTPAPSQFAHEILNANPYTYLDDAPLEERRARAVSLRRLLPEAVLAEIGRLDPAAIEQVRREAWPDVRDADELNEALQVFVALPENFEPPASSVALRASRGAAQGEAAVPDNAAPAGVPVPLPVAEQWGSLFGELVAGRLAARAVAGDRVFWVAAERAKTFSALFPEASLEPPPAEVAEPVPTRDDALWQAVGGWMAHSGPVAAASLAETVGLPETDVEAALVRLEAEGRVLRGQFTDAVPLLNKEGLGVVGPAATTPIPSSTRREAGFEWCDRRLLARIHRLTLGALRREIQPVTPAQFMRWLARWQHAAPGTEVRGERGLLEVIRQMQGFEAPASAWEPCILARRVAGYDPLDLDRLCLTGAVGWGRLSPHPATLEPALKAGGIEHSDSPALLTRGSRGGGRGTVRQQQPPPNPLLSKEGNPDHQPPPGPLLSKEGNPDHQPPPSPLLGKEGNPDHQPPPSPLLGKEGNSDHQPPPGPLLSKEGNPDHQPPPSPLLGKEGNPDQQPPPNPLLGKEGNSDHQPPPGPLLGKEGNPDDFPSPAPRRIVPSSAAPITFFVRDDCDWMIPRHATEVSGALGHAAREVLEYVRERGASFFADIVRGTGKLKSEVEMALWELVTAGLFTADGFDNLRALIDPKRRAGQGRGRQSRPRHSSGRWSLLFPGETADRTTALESVCQVLLRRYGVVFRELTVREEFPFQWRELLMTFRRLEDRGEVRGGRFVDGFGGEQFALPMALESLRAARRLETTSQTITVAAADPLNLAGVILPGERVPVLSGKTTTLQAG